MSNNETQYIIYITEFINTMDKNMHTHFTFDQLYKSVYTLSILGKNDLINKLFNMGKNKVLEMDYGCQNKKYKMLYGVFMYPIRIGIITHHCCHKCNISIDKNILYCNDCNNKLNHLNNIHKFTTFKNDHLIGSRIYETFIL